ncbi:hypothetical protein ACVITL_005799 [Rhizobium pisi]
MKPILRWTSLSPAGGERDAVILRLGQFVRQAAAAFAVDIGLSFETITPLVNKIWCNDPLVLLQRGHIERAGLCLPAQYSGTGNLPGL